MAVLTQGRQAFFSALYYQDDPIITITNVGVGTVLAISATDYCSIPIEQLESMLQEFIGFLTNESLVENLHIHVE